MMPKFEIIIFASLAIVLFLTLTYLLIGLLSKIGQSSKAKYSKTIVVSSSTRQRRRRSGQTFAYRLYSAESTTCFYTPWGSGKS
jgi:hypothetical protein